MSLTIFNFGCFGTRNLNSQKKKSWTLFSLYYLIWELLLALWSYLFKSGICFPFLCLSIGCCALISDCDILRFVCLIYLSLQQKKKSWGHGRTSLRNCPWENWDAIGERQMWKEVINCDWKWSNSLKCIVSTTKAHWHWAKRNWAGLGETNLASPRPISYFNAKHRHREPPCLDGRICYSIRRIARDGSY